MRFGGGKPLAAPQVREGRVEATTARLEKVRAELGGGEESEPNWGEGEAQNRGSVLGESQNRGWRWRRVRRAWCGGGAEVSWVLAKSRIRVALAKAGASMAGLGAALGAELGLAVEFEEAVVHGDVDDAVGGERGCVGADHAVSARVGVGVARELAVLEQ